MPIRPPRILHCRLMARNLWLSVFVLLLCTVVRAQDLEQIAKAKPFEIRGSASASVGYYKGVGFQSTRRPYSYSIMLAPTISVYGVQIPFNVTFTEGSRSINNPFAQFGVNPHWKWIKGYFGWTNMTWSPTTLSGKTFLGAGIEINPSLFRFGAMYGRFNPAIKENLLSKEIQQPQYKRKGWATRIGVGNSDNYVDFIFLAARDVNNSIPVPKDTLNQLTYTPAENVVFGIMSFQTFAKKKLTWQLDGAVSGYTRDTRSPFIDPGTGFGTKALKLIFPPHLSSSYAWTAHSNLTYKAELFTLGFDYNRVQPEYQSMGVDYILNDQQRITLNQTWLAGKKKWTFGFNEFYQHDNLNKRKAVQTHRAGLSSNINFQMNQSFGFSVAYNNFITAQTKGLKPVSDTTRIFQMQNTILFAPRYMIVSPQYIHNIYTSFTYSRLDDFNRFTAAYARNSTINVNVGYSLSVNAMALSFTPGFNVLYAENPTVKLLTLGPSVSLGKSFWKGKISTSLSLGFTASQQNSVWNNKVINNTVGVGYRIDTHHSLKFDNSIMYAMYVASTSQEYRGALTYTYSF